jgi:hypothetical protein
MSVISLGLRILTLPMNISNLVRQRRSLGIRNGKKVCNKTNAGDRADTHAHGEVYSFLLELSLYNLIRRMMMMDDGWTTVNDPRKPCPNNTRLSGSLLAKSYFHQLRARVPPIISTVNKV